MSALHGFRFSAASFTAILSSQMLQNEDLTIAPMISSDWPAVARIYQEGIDTGHASFNPSPPANWDEWCAGRINECSLIARDGGQPVGWACLSPVSSRCCYRGVAEESIYITAGARRRGIGHRLLTALVELSEQHGFWTLQAGIFPENTVSIRLHLAHGFCETGRREKIGRMNFGPLAGTWRDVVLLERRSRMVGID